MFGRIASERGGSLTVNGGIRDNVIATGAWPGIMEAANRALSEADAPSIGFNITRRKSRNRTPTDPRTDLPLPLLRDAQDEPGHARQRAVVFPGGFGTLDELFEILNLRQTGKVAAIADRPRGRGVLAVDHQLRCPHRGGHDRTVGP